jgi:nucleotide-binding universal stress UspA family protein
MRVATLPTTCPQTGGRTARGENNESSNYNRWIGGGDIGPGDGEPAVEQGGFAGFLLCVAPEPQPARRGSGDETEPGKWRKEYRRQIKKESERILAAAAEVLRAEGIDAQPLLQFGSPAKVIVKLAADYDLTVVGGRGARKKTKPGLGGVANRVVEHAPGAVLVVRDAASDRRLRVLFGVDGSMAADRAMEAMTSLIKIELADITLMHVKETPWVHLGLDRARFGYDTKEDGVVSNWESELRDEAEGLIEEARDDLAAYDVTVNPMTVEGNAATELGGEAEKDGYDLVVVGATGATDVKHSMLGSVSARLAGSAPCSVLVVK